MLKRRIAIIFLVLMFIASSALAADFWASKNSKIYHYPTCKWAQKINPQNLVKFVTPEDAIKAGYRACKVCKPPVSSKADLVNGKVTFAQLKIGDKVERSGCCSWHGGVCGCQGGRALCCDGTLSPSCGCD